MSLRTWFQRVTNAQMQGIFELTFYYSVGTALHAAVRYALKYDHETYKIIIIPKYVPEEQAFTREVDDGFAEKLLLILKKYHVGSWNGFRRINKKIADGRSFTLNVGFQNGKSIYAHGYMKYPRHYRDFRLELDELFMSFYPKDRA